MKQKTIFVCQSNYMPWKGYFDAINMADEFVLYDECQYTKNDWRNRNRIKTRNGSLWLSVPIRHNKLSQRILDTKISHTHWQRKHWQSIQQNYRKAPYFKNYAAMFEALYRDKKWIFLSELNVAFLQAICNILHIETPITYSHNYDLKGNKSERLVDLCCQLEATTYLSGPTAKGYLQEKDFEAANVEVQYMNYDNYPVYHQQFSPFEHHVSVLDLIFNEGEHAKKYMKSFVDEKISIYS
ncbi:MAG: WbqC family protein [Chitinophagales bacterium]